MTDEPVVRNGPCVPRPGDVNRRLLFAREAEGLHQERWRRRLADAGYRFARGSISEWERGIEVKNRDKRQKPGVGERTSIVFPPLTYISAVSQVFGYRLDWLVFGMAPLKDPEEAHAASAAEGGKGATSGPAANTASTAGDRDFEARLYGNLAVSLAPRVRWADLTTLRPSVLRLLDEANRFLPGENEAKARGFNAETALRSIVDYLDGLVPVGRECFTGRHDLRPRELELVMLHARALTYILFRPFREADMEFRHSQSASRTPEHAEGPQPGTEVAAVAARRRDSASGQRPTTTPEEKPDHLRIHLRDGEVIPVCRDAQLEAELKARLEALGSERKALTFTTIDGRARDLSPSDIVYVDESAAGEDSTAPPEGEETRGRANSTPRRRATSRDIREG